MATSHPLVFNKIASEPVGFKLAADSPTGPNRVEVVTFANFIPPYILQAQTAKQLYDNLNLALARAVEQQMSVIAPPRAVMLDVLAIATLEREAMMNAMKLIAREHPEMLDDPVE